MRILNLRLKNLNSLVGEWNIDFSHPEYDGNGIFAILGPTGAGKTTLLDAICLALYGKTPRLGKITQNSNELMSRQTGECFAEVTFETARGKYRCFWEQHCSQKKPGKKLQEPQREVVDALTNTILEKHLSRVEAKVEEITGMDFQRFTRSMLLAQGSFDAFLKASPSDRAPILEQITGTEIYSTLSMAAFERAKVENQKLEILQQNRMAIHPLSLEEVHSHHQEYVEKEKDCNQLAAQIQALNEKRSWRQEVDRLSRELAMLEQHWNNFIIEETSSQDDLRKLEMGLKALNHEGDFRDLCHLKKRHQENLGKQIKCKSDKNFIENALCDLDKELLTAHQCYDEASKKQFDEQKIIGQVKHLDSEKKHKTEDLNKLHVIKEQKEKEKAKRAKGLRAITSKYDLLMKQMNELDDYFAKYTVDGSLVENFSSIKENLERYKEKCQLVRQQLNEKNALENELASSKKYKEQTEVAAEKAKTHLQKVKQELSNLSEAYTLLSEGKTHMQWEEERKGLVKQELHLKTVKELVSQKDQLKITLETIHLKKSAAEASLKEKRVCKAEMLEQYKLLETSIESLQRQEIVNTKIHSLKQERANLIDAEPCPLCGSLEHPYAHNNIPQRDAVSQNLVKAKQELKKLEQSKQVVEKTIFQLEIEGESLQKNEVELNHQRNVLDEKLFSISYEDSNQKYETCIDHLKRFETTFTQLSSLREKRDGAQIAYQSELEKFASIEQQMMISSSNLEKLQQQLCYLNQRYESLCKEKEEVENVLLAILPRYGIHHLNELLLEDIKEDLFQRLTQWKQQELVKKGLETDIQKVTLEKAIETNHEQQEEMALHALKSDQNIIQATISELDTKRRDLFGSKSTDEEEKRLLNGIEKAREILTSVKEQKAKYANQNEMLTTSMQELEQLIANESHNLQLAENQFLKLLNSAGFETLESYQMAALSHDERDKLLLKKRSLEKRKVEIETNKQSTEKKLSELHQEQKTTQSFVELNTQIHEYSTTFDQVKERMGQLKWLLADEAKKREAMQSLDEKITLQTKETTVWRKLSLLIGSSDGKKFRDFAQKMTLEMMIAYANRQLVKMSDRYLLKQSKTVPLELEVVDNYQAGEERSVKNLSGGEGFIVSLALALGLSQMASSKVRVDTLFLDEGFGTLDEKALEVALDTLAELHQEGKVIGLISHVGVLKERIGTQIHVQPISGGRSRIDGPGCTQMRELQK